MSVVSTKALVGYNELAESESPVEGTGGISNRRQDKAPNAGASC